MNCSGIITKHFIILSDMDKVKMHQSELFYSRHVLKNKAKKAMEEHTDFVESIELSTKEALWPGDRKVRIVFELYRFEILYHYCEFRHDENSDWKSMTRDDEGYFEYTVTDENGQEATERIKFPTHQELMEAHEEISKKYNLLDV